MLDQNFCLALEYHFTRALSEAGQGDFKYFWCDGILLPLNEDEYSLKSVNDTRMVRLKAFLGQDGQDEYNLYLKFGNKSLSRYSRGLSVEVCMPPTKKTDWYTIDVAKKEIIIYLL